MERVRTIIEPSLAAMGYDVVRLHHSGGQRPVLQVMAERSGDGTMSVDDCAEVSATVSALLDVDDPIRGAYVLEVSSPGIDRPLTRLGDFDRFAGFDARVDLGIAADGRKRFSGRLLGTEGDRVRLEMEGAAVDLPFRQISKAKLMLTDALIAAHGQPMPLEETDDPPPRPDQGWEQGVRQQGSIRGPDGE